MHQFGLLEINDKSCQYLKYSQIKTFKLINPKYNLNYYLNKLITSKLH